MLRDRERVKAASLCSRLCLSGEELPVQLLTRIPPWCMASLHQVLLFPLPGSEVTSLDGVCSPDVAPVAQVGYAPPFISFSSLSCELEVRSIFFSGCGELSLTWRATECVKIYL